MKICGKDRLSCARVARKCRHSDKQFPCDCRLVARRKQQEGVNLKKTPKNRDPGYVCVS